MNPVTNAYCQDIARFFRENIALYESLNPATARFLKTLNECKCTAEFICKNCDTFACEECVAPIDPYSLTDSHFCAVCEDGLLLCNKCNDAQDEKCPECNEYICVSCTGKACVHCNEYQTKIIQDLYFSQNNCDLGGECVSCIRHLPGGDTGDSYKLMDRTFYEKNGQDWECEACCDAK